MAVSWGFSCLFECWPNPTGDTHCTRHTAQSSPADYMCSAPMAHICSNVSKPCNTLQTIIQNFKSLLEKWVLLKLAHLILSITLFLPLNHPPSSFYHLWPSLQLPWNLDLALFNSPPSITLLPTLTIAFLSHTRVSIPSTHKNFMSLNPHHGLLRFQGP